MTSVSTLSEQLEMSRCKLQLQLDGSLETLKAVKADLGTKHAQALEAVKLGSERGKETAALSAALASSVKQRWGILIRKAPDPDPDPECSCHENWIQTRSFWPRHFDQ